MSKNQRAYNIWKDMNMKVRILLAVSVFLIFSTLGPLTILMDNPFRQITFVGVMIVTLCSGGISASIILFARKKLLLVITVSLFMTGNIVADRIEVFLTGPQSFKIYTERDNNVLISKKDFQGIREQRVVLGVFSVLLLALGYTMFIITLQREGRQKIRLETEFQVAKKIQESLNPVKQLQSGDIQVYGIAVAAEEVGGDFFDYLETDGSKVSVFVSDVSGHGIGSGLIAAMTKSSFYSNAEFLDEPSLLFARMNNTLQQITEKAHFVTAAYLSIDAKTNTAKVITGGHHPILHYKAKEKTVQQYRTPNLGFGLQQNFIYASDSFTFSKGDIFLLYTDGIIEARNSKGIEFGIERLVSSMTDYSGNAPEVICSAIMEDLQRYCGKSTFEDDITLICVNT